MKLNKLTLGLATMAVLFLCTQSITADESQSTEDTQIMDTIENTLPNVIKIGNGSGFYIDPAHIMTAWHVVVENLWEGKVGFTNYQGDIVEATLKRYDKKQDYAILDVPRNDKVRTIQTAKLRVGQTVLVLGNPKLIEFSVIKGMVSYIGRPSGYQKLIQIDANITYGNSGSMVITTDGFLVGILLSRLPNSDFAHQWDVGFAIPIDTVK